MSNAFHRLDKVLATFCGLLLAALTLVVTFQVLGRYVPFIPRPLWTEEIARLLLAWLVFVGAAVALRRSDHFVIDLLPAKVDERFGRPLQLLVLVIVAVVALVLLFGGTVLAYGGLTRISTASGLHLAWALAAVPVGGLFMVIFSGELALKTLRGEPLPEPESSIADPETSDRSTPHDRLAAGSGQERDR